VEGMGEGLAAEVRGGGGQIRSEHKKRHGEYEAMVTTATGVYPLQSTLNPHPSLPGCGYHRLNPQVIPSFLG